MNSSHKNSIGKETRTLERILSNFKTNMQGVAKISKYILTITIFSASLYAAGCSNDKPSKCCEQLPCGSAETQHCFCDTFYQSDKPSDFCVTNEYGKKECCECNCIFRIHKGS